MPCSPNSTPPYGSREKTVQVSMLSSRTVAICTAALAAKHLRIVGLLKVFFRRRKGMTMTLSPLLRSVIALAYLVCILATEEVATEEVPAETAAKTIVCVTGVTGYFASELVAQLLDKGWTVRGTVRSLSDSKRTSFLRRLNGSRDRLTLMEADLLIPGSFAECCRGATYLFHTASPFVTRGIKDAQAIHCCCISIHRSWLHSRLPFCSQVELIDPAVHGTENALKTAIEAHVDRVVLTSSMAAVMGRATDKPEDECFDEADQSHSTRP